MYPGRYGTTRTGQCLGLRGTHTAGPRYLYSVVTKSKPPGGRLLTTSPNLRVMRDRGLTNCIETDQQAPHASFVNLFTHIPEQDAIISPTDVEIILVDVHTVYTVRDLHMDGDCTPMSPNKTIVCNEKCPNRRSRHRPRVLCFANSVSSQSKLRMFSRRRRYR